MNYLNRGKIIEVASSIVEYDISSANTSVIKHYNLLDRSVAEKIEQLPKTDRVVAVGKLMKKYPAFSKNLEKGFNEIVEEFIKLNSLDKEEDIVSIKKDAVFVLNKEPKITTIGEFVHFIPKNKYTDYLYCKPYEIYRNKDGFEIKGMNDSIKGRIEKGMLVFFNELFNTCIESGMDSFTINDFMADFTVLYKNKQLPFDFYKEMISGFYKVYLAGEPTLCEYIDDEMLPKLDISYNYIKVILPLIKNLC